MAFYIPIPSHSHMVKLNSHPSHSHSQTIVQSLRGRFFSLSSLCITSFDWSFESIPVNYPVHI